MKSRSRNLWLWLWAALLPLGLYAVIAEQNSWRPFTIQVIPPQKDEQKTVLDFWEWSPDSKEISVVSSYKQQTLINTQTRRIIGPTSKTFAKQSASHVDDVVPDQTTTLDSPDGKYYAALRVETRPYPGADGEKWGRTYHTITQINLHDKKSKKLLQKLWMPQDIPDDDQSIIYAHFLKQGKLLYVQTSHNGSARIQILHVINGQELQDIPANPPEDFIGETVISDDAALAVSFPQPMIGAQTGTDIIVWNIKTRQVIKRYRNPDSPWNARFSPDGTMLAVGGKRGTLTFYRLK